MRPGIPAAVHDALDPLIRRVSQDHAPAPPPRAELLAEELTRLHEEGVAVPGDLARFLAAADGASLHVRGGRPAYRLLPLVDLHWIELGPDPDEDPSSDASAAVPSFRALLQAHGIDIGEDDEPRAVAPGAGPTLALDPGDLLFGFGPPHVEVPPDLALPEGPGWLGPVPFQALPFTDAPERPFREIAPPWAWLRFCELADGSCLALRESPMDPSAWDIAHVEDEEGPEGAARRRIIARSFTEFLERALDGGPEPYFAARRA